MSVNSLGYLSGLTTDFTNVRAMGDFAVDGVLTVQNFSANSFIGMLSANTVNAESGSTVNFLNNVILPSIDSGGRVFDVRAFGLVDSLATDDSFATINVTRMVALASALSATRGATIYVPSTGSGRAFLFSGASTAAAAAIPLPPYTNLQIDGTIKRGTGVQGRFVGLSFQNRVYGSGTIDGNSTLSMVRGLGNHNIYGPSGYAAPSGETAGYWWIDGLTLIRPQSFNINLNGNNIWIQNNRVDSTWGSVDGEEPDIVSGDNNDGIHVANASNVWITNNRVEAIDDCIAWTCLNSVSGATNFENVYIAGNICQNRKAQFVASAGLGGTGTAGTLKKLLGGGCRITTEINQEDGLTAKNFHVKDNTFIGGTFGVMVGHQSNDTNRTISQVQITGNKFQDILATSGATSDYSGNGRVGVVRVRTADYVTIDDNDFNRSGSNPVFLVNARYAKVRNNWMRDFDTDYCGLTVSNIRDRAAITLYNSPGTYDTDDILIEDNTASSVDGAFVLLDKPGAGTMSNIRIRRNRVSGHNSSALTLSGAAAFSLKNGADAANISVIENRDNKVLGYTITGTTDATEANCATIQSQSVLVDISSWTPDMLGSGRMFSAVNGSGTMTAAVTGEGTLYCSGTAANDEVRTDVFSAAPWLGRVMEVTVMLYIISGTVAINNGQQSATIAADATDRWKKHHVVLSADETSNVRLRLLCSGGAAEFYVGKVEALLSNV